MRCLEASSASRRSGVGWAKRSAPTRNGGSAFPSVTFSSPKTFKSFQQVFTATKRILRGGLPRVGTLRFALHTLPGICQTLEFHGVRMMILIGFICFAVYSATVKLGWRYFLVSLLFLAIISTFATIGLRGANGPTAVGVIMFVGTILQAFFIAHGIKWLCLLIKYSLKLPAFFREVRVNSERIGLASFLATKIKNSLADLLKKELQDFIACASSSWRRKIVTLCIVLSVPCYTLLVKFSVANQAQTIAAGRPYCILVATTRQAKNNYSNKYYQYKDYKPADRFIDTLGLYMRGDGGINHAVLVVGDRPNAISYHWSYLNHRFIEGSYGGSKSDCRK